MDRSMNKTDGFRGPSLVLVILALIPFIYPTIPEASGLEPVCYISIHQKEQHVRVDPSSDGTVNFTGEVFVEFPVELRCQYLFADLRYSATRDGEVWNTSGTQQILFPKGVTRQRFYCNVSLPIGTSSNGSGLLTVNATWSLDGGSISGEIPPDRSFIYIQSYSNVIITAEKRCQEVKKNKDATFTFSITNDGNAKEKIKIAIIASKRVILKGDFTDQFIDEGEKHCNFFPLIDENGTIDFKLKASSDEAGTHRIRIYVYSNSEFCFNSPREIFELRVDPDIFDSVKSHPFQWGGGLVLSLIMILAVALVLYKRIRAK